MSSNNADAINSIMTPSYTNLRITVFSDITEAKDINKVVDLTFKEAQRLGLDITIAGKSVAYAKGTSLVVAAFFNSFVLAVLLVTVFLGFTYRSYKLALLALIPNVLPVLSGGIFIYLFQIPMDIGTVMVGAITLGIAVDDTVHFLSQYYYERKREGDSLQCLANVLQDTAPALTLTTLILTSFFGSM